MAAEITTPPEQRTGRLRLRLSRLATAPTPLLRQQQHQQQQQQQHPPQQRRRWRRML
jgi:hypothetical protein